MSDLSTILYTRTAVDATNLLKTVGEQDVVTMVELSAQYRGSWGCLVDMGYIGIAHSLGENFFGRMCTLWKISLATYTWDEKNYNTIQRTAFALTNFHLSLMPLRVEDEGFY
ncbi:hypothetical protein DYB37_009664, partial [Aphanomyces astaci]